MQRGRLILAIVIAALVLILIFQNLESTTTRLLFVKVTMPLAATLAITLVAGFLIGLIVAMMLSRRKEKA
jgi:uncharacterized integral membrane protein